MKKNHSLFVCNGKKIYICNVECKTPQGIVAGDRAFSALLLIWNLDNSKAESDEQKRSRQWYFIPLWVYHIICGVDICLLFSQGSPEPQ